MNRDFLAALVDTLLPGDTGDPPLPSASAVGVAARLASQPTTSHRAVIDAIARAAGDEVAFVRAEPSARVEILRRIEQEFPPTFRALVHDVLVDYYEADAVLLAFGWRVEPPQPAGHGMPPFDESLLEPVKRRGMHVRPASEP